MKNSNIFLVYLLRPRFEPEEAVLSISDQTVALFTFKRVLVFEVPRFEYAQKLIGNQIVLTFAQNEQQITIQSANAELVYQQLAQNVNSSISYPCVSQNIELQLVITLNAFYVFRAKNLVLKQLISRNDTCSRSGGQIQYYSSVFTVQLSFFENSDLDEAYLLLSFAIGQKISVFTEQPCAEDSKTGERSAFELSHEEEHQGGSKTQSEVEERAVEEAQPSPAADSVAPLVIQQIPLMRQPQLQQNSGAPAASGCQPPENGALGATTLLLHGQQSTAGKTVPSGDVRLAMQALTTQIDALMLGTRKRVILSFELCGNRFAVSVINNCHILYNNIVIEDIEILVERRSRMIVRIYPLAEELQVKKSFLEIYKAWQVIELSYQSNVNFGEIL